MEKNMSVKCPHCGSKYVLKKNTEDGFSEKKQHYYCQSCKKDFYISESKHSAQGIWLMTFHGMFGDKIEVYREKSGEIAINQQTDKGCISGSVRLRLYTTKVLSDYQLRIDTFQHSYDTNGTLFGVKKIEMNKEMAQRALNNESMRICHSHSHIYDEVFNIEKHVCQSKELCDDIAEYLQSILGAHGMSLSEKVFDGCYVATAVYGSYDCPQVWTLRRFRDNILATTWHGRVFIHTYYAISPTLVKWFGHTEWFKHMWRGTLDKIVDTLQKQGIADTPYQDRIW